MNLCSFPKQVAVAILGLGWICGTFTACSHQPYALTNHYDGEHFYNEDRSAETRKGLFSVLKWALTRQAAEWPDSINDNVAPQLTVVPAAGHASVTFINHATQLLRFAEATVITDPVFSERVSPVTWLGPKRHRQPGVALQQLPPVDLVLISHNHYDHLDLTSLKELATRYHPTFLVPLGTRDLLVGAGIEPVLELDWWQTYQAKGGLGITLVPMQHSTARGPFDSFTALWGGYVIKAPGIQVLFCGDTGYNKQFSEIEHRFGPMDLSLIPIGAYAPRWFMRDQHMDPAEAVQAHIDLHSRLSIGMHYGTFQLTDEGVEDPVRALALSLQKAKISPDKFLAPKNGQTTFVSGG